MLYAIFDLDGTLSDCEWRRPFAAAAKLLPHGSAERSASWESFHSRCDQDEPHAVECLLVRLWADAGHGVIYLTGRTDTHRAKTTSWLRHHNLPEGILIMRPAGSMSRATDYKQRMLHVIMNQILTPEDRVSFVMEDDDRVVALWRSLGLTCLQPRGSSH